MKLKQLASNMTELTLNNGTVVLFSYETPVAYYESKTNTVTRTSKNWSRTTTKHIRKWINDLDQRGLGDTSYLTIEQEVLDNLVRG